MTDADIVTLYWARDEQAIAQTAQKFGAYCRKIAMNLLGSQEDAEECENDTWMAAWNSMPQQPAPSAHFCAASRSRHATSLFGGTGTATPPPTLPSATVLVKARCALPCTGCAPN